LCQELIVLIQNQVNENRVDFTIVPLSESCVLYGHLIFQLINLNELTYHSNQVSAQKSILSQKWLIKSNSVVKDFVQTWYWNPVYQFPASWSIYILFKDSMNSSIISISSIYIDVDVKYYCDHATFYPHLIPERPWSARSCLTCQ